MAALLQASCTYYAQGVFYHVTLYIFIASLLLNETVLNFQRSFYTLGKCKMHSRTVFLVKLSHEWSVVLEILCRFMGYSDTQYRAQV